MTDTETGEFDDPLSLDALAAIIDGESDEITDDVGNDTNDTGEEHSDEEQAAEDVGDTAESDEEKHSDEEQADPHDYWSDEVKERYAALDEKTQDLVDEITQGASASFTQKMQELAESTKGFETLTQVRDSWTPYLQQLGPNVSFEGAVHGLLQTEAVLRTGTDEQKKQALTNIINKYGIDLGTSSQVNGEDDDLDEYDEDDPLVRRIRSLEKKLETAESAGNGKQPGAANLQHQQAMQRAAEFRDAVDDKGNKLHPHFDMLAREMVALLEKGLVPQGDLQAAYERAERSNPETYALLQKKTPKTVKKPRGRRAANRPRGSTKPATKPIMPKDPLSVDALGAIVDSM